MKSGNMVIERTLEINKEDLFEAICTFTGREYKYDPAQRGDTVIYHDDKGVNDIQDFKEATWKKN